MTTLHRFLDLLHAMPEGTARPYVRWLCVVVATACVALLAPVASAPASSIVYLDSNKNVWITSPDGANHRQLTTDGPTNWYASPSETDAGVIVAPGLNARFYYFNQNGTVATGGWWIFGDMRCPTSEHAGANQVRPDATMNVHSFLSPAPLRGCVRKSGSRTTAG